MAHDPRSEAEFHARLKSAMQAGAAGRAEIMQRLAVLPVERLAAVPPSILAMIGSAGLAELAVRRLDLAPLTAGAPASGAVPMAPSSSRSPRSRSFAATGAVMIGILLVTLMVDSARPYLARLGDPGSRSVYTATWPVCPRLDTFIDGCLYRTGSGGLTLDRAAGLLGLAPSALASTNTHLLAFEGVSLPPGATLVVWRGTLELRGAH